MANLPHLNDVTGSVDPREIQFISITDEQPATINKFLASHKILGWVGLDRTLAGTSPTFDHYGVTSRPTTIILDPHGRMAAITRAEEVTAADLTAIAHLPAATPVAEKNHPPAKIAAGAAAPSAPAPVSTPASPADSGSSIEQAIKQATFRVSITRTQDKSQSWLHDPKDDTSYALVGFMAPDLIRHAFDLNATRTTFDHDFGDARYTLLIVGVPKAMQPELLQTAVRESFHLQVKRTKETRDVWVLKATTPGSPKLMASSPQTGKNLSYTAGKLYLVHANMADLATQLEGELKTPVLDETGLNGFYDLQLSFRNTMLRPPNRPSQVSAWSLSKQHARLKSPS